MASDAAAAAAAPEEVEAPRVSLELFTVIKIAQRQNGLRHHDYWRYSSFLSHRLRSLRKALKLTHSRKYTTERAVTPADVKDERALLIPLFLAERCWTQALSYKAQYSEEEPRPLHHMLRRLKKAAKHAEALAALAEARGDAKAVLETRAYAAWMKGEALIERSHFAEAAPPFLEAEAILLGLREKLGTAQPALGLLYLEKLANVQPKREACTSHAPDSPKAAKLDKSAQGLLDRVQPAANAAQLGEELRATLVNEKKPKNAQKQKQRELSEKLKELLPEGAKDVRKSTLTKFPPKMTPIQPKPIFIDLAYNFVKYDDLSQLSAEPKKKKLFGLF